MQFQEQKTRMQKKTPVNADFMNIEVVFFIELLHVTLHSNSFTAINIPSMGAIVKQPQHTPLFGVFQSTYIKSPVHNQYRAFDHISLPQ
jgi:hypothetical protein